MADKKELLKAGCATAAGAAAGGITAASIGDIGLAVGGKKKFEEIRIYSPRRCAMRIPLFVPVVLLCGFLVHGCSGSGDNCTPNNRTICKDGVVYWVDSCGNQGDKAGDCDCGCNADFTACKTPCDCEPNCQGKECGPDGCDGTCLPGCSGGDTCNEQTGQCECAPNCTGKECGSDGCGSECPPGCGSGESCSAEGICISTGCGSVPLSVQGTLDTGGANVEFDHVEASFTHKRDIDEYEDGCIVQVDVSLMNSTGCQLHVVAGNRYNGDGALVVQSFEFSADSFCPNLMVS